MKICCILFCLTPYCTIYIFLFLITTFHREMLISWSRLLVRIRVACYDLLNSYQVCCYNLLSYALSLTHLVCLKNHLNHMYSMKYRLCICQWMSRTTMEAGSWWYCLCNHQAFWYRWTVSSNSKYVRLLS